MVVKKIKKCSSCFQIDPNIISVDYGIGAYEYWGFTGINKNIKEVSECCEAEIIEEYNDK